MLIITGTGRCGSSVSVKLLKSIGYGIGNLLSYDEGLRAGLEFAPAYAINRDLYNDFISKNREIDLDKETELPYWGKISYRERILRIDRDDISGRPQGKIDLIKDPRFTWHPDLIKIWFNVRKDLKLLILYRSPEQVVASRQFVIDSDNKWKNFEDPKRGSNYEEMEDDLVKFMDQVSKIGIEFEYLVYPDFLIDLNLLYSSISNLGYNNNLTFEECLMKWKDIVDLSLVHDFGE